LGEAARLLLARDPDVKGSFQPATALSVILFQVMFCIMATFSHFQQWGTQ
jgi:hypothetical protein